MGPTRRLGYADLVVGRALSFDILDAHGRTLLSLGYVIPNQAQLERIVDRGAFVEIFEDESAAAAHVPEKLSPFRLVADVADSYATLFEGGFDELACAAIPGIVDQIQACCERDADAALGVVLLHRGERYSLRHAFGAAVFAELLLRQLEATAEARHHALAGALTMNIGMQDLQDALYHQETPLTPEQKLGIVQHPRGGRALLERMGVTHPVWLDVVENHHEMIDGSGYAARKRGGQLCLQAQVVSLADRYCAMVSERAYRAGTLPSVAAKDLLSRQAATIDPAVAAAFLKVVGVYPPGTVVLLANGEVGVVVRRTLHPAQPVVRAIRARSGVRHDVPPKRLTSRPAYEIKEALGLELARDTDPALLWPPAQIDGEEGEDGDAAE